MKQFLRRLFRGKKEEFVLVYAQISDLFYSENCFHKYLKHGIIRKFVHAGLGAKFM